MVEVTVTGDLEQQQSGLFPIYTRKLQVDGQPIALQINFISGAYAITVTPLEPLKINGGQGLEYFSFDANEVGAFLPSSHPELFPTTKDIVVQFQDGRRFIMEPDDDTASLYKNRGRGEKEKVSLKEAGLQDVRDTCFAWAEALIPQIQEIIAYGDKGIKPHANAFLAQFQQAGAAELGRLQKSKKGPQRSGRS